MEKTKVYLTPEVREALSSMSKKRHARTLREIKLLESWGYKLKYPHSKKIDKDIYELRAVGNPQIRLFYTFNNNAAIIFDLYIKKTQKIPKRVLDRVRKKVRLFTR